eukprot:3307909-Rhodomonas_salina.2
MSASNSAVFAPFLEARVLTRGVCRAQLCYVRAYRRQRAPRAKLTYEKARPCASQQYRMGDMGQCISRTEWEIGGAEWGVDAWSSARLLEVQLAAYAHGVSCPVLRQLSAYARSTPCLVLIPRMGLPGRARGATRSFSRSVDYVLRCIFVPSDSLPNVIRW